MKNKRISDVVLVYDRYYNNKPNPVTLIAKRVGLCCAMTLCAVMFLLTEYGLPVNLIVCGVLTVLFTACFSMMFVFIRKRFAIPGVLIIFGLAVWLSFESFWEKFTYFLDAFFMAMDGRFVSGTALTYHSSILLTVKNELYTEGVMFGTVLVIAAFSMISAAGMFPKPHALPSFLCWIAMWVPLFISERFTFKAWIIPAVAVYMGVFAAAIAYKEGLALKSGKNGAYRSSASMNERSFKNSLARVPYSKRIGMMSTHYSKYFSLTLYAVSIFTVIGVISGIIFSSTEGIDYTKLYEFVTSIGQRAVSGNNPPFEINPIDDYFTTNETSPNLGITSPGNSEMEVLRVTNNSGAPVYLRGDYGINFYGERWSSPVNNEPREWKTLKDSYRPAEALVLQRILQNADPLDDTVENADISVEYLCDSKTVFLPAYTENFNYYENSMFNIYGDYVVRVNDRFSKVTMLEFTALVPKYTNQTGSAGEQTMQYVNQSIDAVNKWDFEDIMNKVVSGSSVETYKSYVYKTFVLSLTDQQSRTLSEFEHDNPRLMDRLEELLADWELTNLERRYLIADLICEYLRDNYTYSLSNENTGSNAIGSFLNETKRGHCALYASAMTMFLRRHGIPARYATGFVVPPTGGSSVVLRSKNLHAWCEVYMDELGWVTFDPTSSAAFAGDPIYNNTFESRPTSSSSSESSSSSSSNLLSSDSESSDEESESVSSDQSNDESSGMIGKDDDETGFNVLPYILIMLAIAAVVLLAVLIVRWYKSMERKALRSLRKICRERKANTILEKVISLLEVGGLTPKPGELPDKFYLRAEKTMRCAFSVNKDMLKAVAFGTAAVPRTDCEGLARLLEQLYNALYKKFGIFDRIKLWKIVI